MIERIREMLKKEFRQVLRDPRMRGIIFVMPMIQLFVFSYAVNTDVKNITAAVMDFDNSVASREVISRFEHSGYFTIKEYVVDEKRAEYLVNRGLVQTIIRINAGFSRDLESGQSSQIQIIVDGTESNVGAIALDYAGRIIGEYSRGILLTKAAMILGSVGPSANSATMPAQINLEPRAWFNENLESRNFYVPGVIALMITMVTLTLTSMSIVREKEVGTIEQIMVTPITPAEFILGKTVPFALIAILDVIIVTVVGVYWFDVPLRGSILLLISGAAVYLLTTLGIGLLISTVSQTQQQAMMSTFFFFLPTILLSGFIFPIANMPGLIQLITYINPMRYFLVIIRGIFLKGVGMNVLWPQYAALGVIGFVTMWLATTRFKKTME